MNKKKNLKENNLETKKTISLNFFQENLVWLNEFLDVNIFFINGKGGKFSLFNKNEEVYSLNNKSLNELFSILKIDIYKIKKFINIKNIDKNVSLFLKNYPKNNSQSFSANEIKPFLLNLTKVIGKVIGVDFKIEHKEKEILNLLEYEDTIKKNKSLISIKNIYKNEDIEKIRFLNFENMRLKDQSLIILNEKVDILFNVKFTATIEEIYLSNIKEILSSGWVLEHQEKENLKQLQKLGESFILQYKDFFKFNEQKIVNLPKTNRFSL